jgi:hypothetical protein
VLRRLLDEDADFGEQVRRAIFTFGHIPNRLRRAMCRASCALWNPQPLSPPLPPPEAMQHWMPPPNSCWPTCRSAWPKSCARKAAERGPPAPPRPKAAMGIIVAAIRTLEAEIVRVSPRRLTQPGHMTRPCPWPPRGLGQSGYGRLSGRFAARHDPSPAAKGRHVRSDQPRRHIARHP